MATKHSEIDLERAGNTAGWMTYPELKWLARQAQKHQKIVEIGSYQGRSTSVLGDHTEGIVYAVDDFIGPRDKQHTGLPIFEIFCGNLLDLIQQGKVVPVVADHRNVQLSVRPDMVFIDGGHNYGDVKYDISRWLPEIVPGGLICGHDATFTQVDKAVKEILPKAKVARGTTIWFAFV